VDTGKYNFNGIPSNQHCNVAITQPKECLIQCDESYAEVMFNLNIAVVGDFSEIVELYIENRELFTFFLLKVM